MSDLSHFLERLIPDAGLRVGSDLIASHEIRGLRFDCLHLDRLDPVLSGNKVFKLLGHLEGVALARVRSGEGRQVTTADWWGSGTVNDDIYCL